MKTIWHLIKTDCRRFRWVIGGVLAGQIAATAMALAEIQNPSGGGFVVALVPWGVCMALASLLALLVQGDAAHGSMAYWMTRPISAFQLSCAKTIEVVLFIIVLPVIIHAGFLVSLGLGPRALLNVALGIAAFVGLFVPLLMLVAALAGTFFRFWLIVFAGFLGLSLVITQIVPRMPAVRPGLQESCIAVVFLTGAFSCLWLVWYLYASRSIKRVLLTVVALMILMMSVPYWWRWNVVGADAKVTLPLVAAPEGLSVAMGNARCDPVYGKGASVRRRTLSVGLFVEGGAKLKAWRLVKWSGQAIWSDGSTTQVTLRTDCFKERARAQSISMELNTQASLINTLAIRDGFKTELRTSLIVKTKQAPDRFEGKIQGEVVESARLWELPLQTGAAWFADSAGIAIKSVSMQKNQIELVVRGQVPTRFFGERTQADKAVQAMDLVMVNRRTKEAVLLNSISRVEESFFGISTMEVRLTATLPETGQAGDLSWQQDASLFVMTTQVLERFEVPANFSVSPQ